VPQIEMVIDEEKKVTHSKLASKTEDVIMDPSKIKFKVIDLHLCPACSVLARTPTAACWESSVTTRSEIGARMTRSTDYALMYCCHGICTPAWGLEPLHAAGVDAERRTATTLRWSTEENRSSGDHCCCIRLIAKRRVSVEASPPGLVPSFSPR
jgi:hypothetical protein